MTPEIITQFVLAVRNQQRTSTARTILRGLLELLEQLGSAGFARAFVERELARLEAP